jgi:hypothetical protein
VGDVLARKSSNDEKGLILPVVPPPKGYELVASIIG